MINTFFSLLLLLTFHTNYLCNNSDLDLSIRNNINGDFALVENLSEIKPGAFINIKWGDKKLMLPYSPTLKYLSFSDKKWDWRYEYDEDYHINEEDPKLYELMPSGSYNEYECKIIKKSDNNDIN